MLQDSTNRNHLNQREFIKKRHWIVVHFEIDCKPACGRQARRSLALHYNLKMYQYQTLLLYQLSPKMNPMKKELNILIAAVLLWCGFILATPVLASFGGTSGDIADILYRLYGVVCHQFDSRSFHMYDHSFAVCIRCTAIYFGFFGSIIFVRSGVHFKGGRHHWIVGAALPMFIDALFDTVGIFPSSTVSRLITGGIFGFGMAIVLVDSVLDAIRLYSPGKKLTHDISN